MGMVYFERAGACLGVEGNRSVVHVAECGLKPAAGEEVSVEELKRFLSGSLPEYMVPSRFVVVDKLPLTPNNKVDREALSRMEGGRLEPGTAFAAAESGMEERLLGIWRRVLKQEKVGVADNFFDLGGDSVGVAEVQNLIHAELDREVPIIKLFEFPTIRGLARQMEGSGEQPEAVADADRQALEWARANPCDARATLIWEKLRKRGVEG